MKVSEVEAKQVVLSTELETALTAAKVLTPATPEFDEAYQRYLTAKAGIAKIPDELVIARTAENADAIAVCGTQVAEALNKLIEGLKVAELLGTPVEAVRYAVDSEGKALVVFNPVIKLKSSGGKSTGAKGAGRTVIVDPNGEKWSLTKFVLAHATEAEKASDAFKYPHTKVDTKPKFDEFCTGHNLSGYTYEVPATEEASTS